MFRKKNGFALIFVILLILAAGAAGYFAYQYYKLSNNLNQMSEVTASPEASAMTEASPSASTNPTAGWNTYTNSDFNYQLSYPTDWTAKETKLDKWEMSGKHVEYVSFYSPGNIYMLTFGVRNIGQDLGLTTRTGTGAGDFVDAQPIMIAGYSVGVRNLVYQNKIKAVYYQDKTGNAKLGNLEMYADFDYVGTDPNYGNYDLTNSNELKVANQILESFKLTK